MARPGITFSDVVAAANQLIGQGKQPTIEQIRLMIGSGSSTTISNHLRQWKQQQQSTSLLASKENLPLELVELVKGLWQRVIGQSEEKRLHIEKEFISTISGLQEDVAKYKNNNQRWQQLYSQWQKEKDTLSHQLNSAEQQTRLLHIDNVAKQATTIAQNQQLQDKQQRIEELQRLHVQTQTNLEHFRESVRVQQLRQHQQSEQEKQVLQSTVTTLKEQLMTTQNKLIAREQKNQTLHHAYMTLEKSHFVTVSKLETEQQQYIVLDKQYNNQQQKCQHFESQYKEVCNALEIKTTQLTELQADNKVATQQLSDAANSIQVLQQQVAALTEEKWNFIRERAQLDNQLQHMKRVCK